MATIGKTRSLLNSIVTYFRPQLTSAGFTKLQYATGDPEDKRVVFQDEYNKLTSAQKRDALRVPCFIINVDNVRDGDSFGIGEDETWVEIPIAIDIYAESPGQKLSIGDYIQEELEDESISWYDYSTTNSPTSSELYGNVDFKNVLARYPTIIGETNKALKNHAHISCIAEVSRAT